MLNFKPKAVESPQSAVRTKYCEAWVIDSALRTWNVKPDTDGPNMKSISISKRLGQRWHAHKNILVPLLHLFFFSERTQKSLRNGRLFIGHIIILLFDEFTQSGFASGCANGFYHIIAFSQSAYLYLDIGFTIYDNCVLFQHNAAVLIHHQ